MRGDDSQSGCRAYSRVKSCSRRDPGSAQRHEKNVIGLQTYVGSFRLQHLLQRNARFGHSGRALADDAGSAHLCGVIRSARERQCLQHGQAAVIHEKTGGMAHVPHHVDDRRPGHRDGVSWHNLDIVLQIVSQVPGQVHGDWRGLTVLPDDAYLPSCRSREAPRRRDEIVQLAVPKGRIDAGLHDVAQDGYSLRSGFVEEDRDVSVADKSPIFQPLLDQSLGLFHREVAHVHVVNQRKVNVS